MTWNYFDIVVAILLLYAIYKGFSKGLIISLATLIGLILGVYGGLYFSDTTAVFLKNQFGVEIPILSFTLTFLVILIAVFFIGKLIEKFINILSLGIFNKIGGLIFNLSKMLLILSVLTVIIEETNSIHNFMNFSYIKEGFFYNYLKQAEEIVFPYFDLLSESDLMNNK